MAIEGFDAGLLIETSGFVPQAWILEDIDANAGPTLEAALRQAGQAPGLDAESMSDRATRRAEMAEPDLWIGQGLLVRASHIDPADGLAADPQSTDGIFVLRDLSVFEKTLVAGGLGTTDPEIVVTGPDGDNGWSPWDDDPFEPEDNDNDPDGDWQGQGGPDDDPTDNPYAERVTIDPSVPADQRDRAELVRDKLAAELRDVGEKINSLDANQRYRYGDREFTGAELKSEFAKIGFNITWEKDYGPWGRGANDNGRVSANLPFLEGQLAQNYPWGAWGTNWLILHELAHLLGILETFLNDRWTEYLASDSTPTLEEFQLTQGFFANETLANQITYLLGIELGLPTGPNPPPGYDPALAGSGGTGGGGGGPDDGGNTNHN